MSPMTMRYRYYQAGMSPFWPETIITLHLAIIKRSQKTVLKVQAVELSIMSSLNNPLDVIIIGSGFSGKPNSDLTHSVQHSHLFPHPLTQLLGICAGLQLQSKFKNLAYGIFDKAGDIGGTWSKNTYPNLSCDIPSQVSLLSLARRSKLPPKQSKPRQ